MIAIIPARGGSKGLPGKNILPFCGKPLIAWTIEAALACKSLDRVIVSTDSEEIADTARTYGAEVPGLRPRELALDNSSAIDVYIYLWKKLTGKAKSDPVPFVVLQPTSPLRTTEDINTAVKLFHEKKADSVISVSEATHPPVWAKKIDEKGVLRNYFETSQSLFNRQQIPVAYMPNGAVFILKNALVAKNRNYYSDKTYPYHMPYERSLDIDNIWDFRIAEYIMNFHLNNKK
ncbi:MAG: acylneuraminate cytidylyltransferase family protein [Bacteroidales bacterium]|nr:acylneuraminate cytidylyltransferase family protein [Bacteroidales bacterium]